MNGLFPSDQVHPSPPYLDGLTPFPIQYALLHWCVPRWFLSIPSIYYKTLIISIPSCIEIALAASASWVFSPLNHFDLCFKLINMLGLNFKQVPQTYDEGQHEGRQAVSKEDIQIRKGCLKIKVGQGEEQQKVTVPVNYLKHPLFVQLLKEAEEEYGFSQKGTITIPCQVAEFKNVQHLIHTERSLHHHHHLVATCFKA